MKWVLFLVSLAVGASVFWLLVSHTAAVDVKVVDTHFFGADTSHTENQIQRTFDPSANVPLDVCMAIGVTLLWPVIGAIVVGIWELLRAWAYNGKKVESLWDNDNERTSIKMGLAAIWPVTFAYSVVVYPSMAIITRLF